MGLKEETNKQKKQRKSVQYITPIYLLACGFLHYINNLDFRV